MTNETRMHKWRPPLEGRFSSFGFSHSFVIRHSSFVILCGQDHANSRAVSEFTFCLHASAVQLRYMFHNRQPKTGAFQFATARLVSTIKALENSRQMLFADPRSVVRDA